MSSKHDTGDHRFPLNIERRVSHLNLGSGGRDAPAGLRCLCGRPAETGYRQCTRCETVGRIICHLPPSERIKLANGKRTLYPAL